jgi:protein SCO1/2
MKKDRRQVIAAAAGALPGLALGMTGAPPAEVGDDCARPARGPDAERFPNHVVVAHDGSRALFYDDLVAGKTVLLHCMSIATEPVYKTTESLAGVQRLLAGRLGRDLFLYSLTVDPERDSPRALAELAARCGAGPGWRFLTGEPEAMLDLRQRLFFHGRLHQHGDGDGADCAMAMLRYGNAAVGLWGAVPAKAAPARIVERLSWVQARAVAYGTPHRRGPAPPRA